MIRNIKNKETQKGFTLIEMTIAMLILSLLVAFATVAFSSLLRRNFEKKTFADMEVIADAMAVYAQKHMRVPCPADPTGAGPENFGMERGSNGNVFGQCDTIALSVGMLPFATLGLPQKMTLDRFGNMLTYHVSTTSSLPPVVAATQEINQWCMTRPYWHADVDFDGITDDFVNPAKAAFCCGTWGVAPWPDGTDGDVEIRGAYDQPLPNLSRQVDDGSTSVGANSAEYIDPGLNTPPSYAQLDGSVLGAGYTSTAPPMFPAYVLVSHGQNGGGAYQTSSGVRGPVAGLSVPEIENTNDDTVYFASDRVSPLNPVGAGATRLDRQEIDDIVFWESPSQILGRIGGISCSSP